MAVKIIIKRVTPEDKIIDLMKLLKKLRIVAVNQPGYISGETLKSYENPGEYLVISTWQSLDDWKNWVQSKERAEIQGKIDHLIGKETEYGIYLHG